MIIFSEVKIYFLIGIVIVMLFISGCTQWLGDGSDEPLESPGSCRTSEGRAAMCVAKGTDCQEGYYHRTDKSCAGGKKPVSEIRMPTGKAVIGGAKDCCWPTQCNDQIDNDGDGVIDYPADDGCYNLDDNYETIDCDDYIDNDGDGLIDLADPGCNNNASAPRENTCGQVITEDYYLTSDIVCDIDRGGRDGEVGIEVGASDVTVDCQGYAILGPDEVNSIGIKVASGLSNILLKDCYIDEFYYGVFSSSSDVKVYNNVITDGEGYGIKVFGNVHGKTDIRYNLVENQGGGIYLRGTDRNIVSYNIVKNSVSWSGFNIEDSDNNTIEDNEAKNNAQTGFYIRDSSYNQIHNNVATNNGVSGIGSGISFSADHSSRMSRWSVLSGNTFCDNAQFDVSCCTIPFGPTCAQNWNGNTCGNVTNGCGFPYGEDHCAFPCDS